LCRVFIADAIDRTDEFRFRRSFGDLAPCDFHRPVGVAVDRVHELLAGEYPARQPLEQPELNGGQTEVAARSESLPAWEIKHHPGWVSGLWMHVASPAGGAVVWIHGALGRQT
jgi:hypothetical protein